MDAPDRPLVAPKAAAADAMRVPAGDPTAAARRWMVVRRDAAGRAERVFTVFDTALTALRLFEATDDPRHLVRGLEVVLPLQRRHDGAPCWSFSPAVDDSPPDVDTTASVLLLIEASARAGVAPVREWTDPTPLFVAARDSGGGLRTYFGQRRNNHVDPVVNLCAAEWLARTGRAPSLLEGIGRHLDGVLARSDWSRPLSTYYLDNAFLAWRASRVAALRPSLLGGAARAKVERHLLEARPLDPLHAALALEACAALGVAGRPDALAAELRRARRPRGTWGWCGVYAQATPRYVYGSSRLTTAAASAALRATGARGDR